MGDMENRKKGTLSTGAGHLLTPDRRILGHAPEASTLPELVRQLPGQLHATQHAAEWLVRLLGDRDYWHQHNLIMQAVARGTIHPERVVSAFEQATRSKAGAPPIRNKGAKFWRALQCLARITAEDLPSLAAGRAKS
jgi:hypothetical protein